MRIPYVYWQPNEDFIADLCKHLQGKSVLEIFAGNGYLASRLSDNGITVKATTIFSGHDGHHEKLYYPVEECSAIQAVRKYAHEHDVLLICWPTTVEDVTYAVRMWGKEKDIIFIGEVTNYERNELGGCATDSFFQVMRFHHEFKTYHGNYIEHALVGRLK